MRCALSNQEIQPGQPVVVLSGVPGEEQRVLSQEALAAMWRELCHLREQVAVLQRKLAI